TSEPYSMTLNSDGTFTFDTLDGQPITSGAFAIRGDTLQWVVDTYCSDPATYHWAYADDALTFAIVGEDTCADRLASLSMPFTKP
ncbi:MAG: hypothetical protein K8I30_03300, partial [Anaerolineae bacterium]|nr:hypothetical protein [Anaerolineae bacterium]